MAAVPGPAVGASAAPASVVVSAAVRAKTRVLNFFIADPVVVRPREGRYNLRDAALDDLEIPRLGLRFCPSPPGAAFHVFIDGCFTPMAVLPILHYPDARLHRVAEPVAQVDDAIRRLVQDMAETMYAAPGVGLAATQVDVHKRVVVIDVSEDKSDLRVLINPEILTRSEDSKVYEEGCLSVPGIYDEVERPDRVTVKALDLSGQPYTFEADGLLAVCVQHEIDHLDGKVFVQYLSRLKQGRIRTKLAKAAEKAAEKAA